MTAQFAVSHTECRDAASTLQCPVCATALQPQRQPWLFRCAGCGLLQSTLEPSMGEAASIARVDVPTRDRSLQGLRERNFARILDLLAPLAPTAAPRLLEVGCAHGWFLKAAAERGFQVRGIEADPDMAPCTQADLGITHGFFPDVLQPGETFDVIIFNDVLEHIPDVRQALAHCARVLEPGGLLVVNAPDRRGVLYRIATLLARFGRTGPLDRLWQVGFPSPHLYYFAPADLVRLTAPLGFTELRRSRLESVSLRDLWPRIRYDTALSWGEAAGMWALLAPLTAVMSVLPSDISLQIFRRGKAP
jgi:SAM-dependent methyltransferase